MREARKSPEGRWYLLEKDAGVCRLSPLAWERDARGFWPRLELPVRSLGETVVCPACSTTWVLEEMDCVFGTARREGNDVLVLVRCVGCRLPHRARGVGFITAYPRLVQLMEGWVGWKKRGESYDAEERRLYGPSGEPEEG